MQNIEDRSDSLLPYARDCLYLLVECKDCLTSAITIGDVEVC